MNLKIDFRLRWLGSIFLVFARTLPFGNGRLHQTENLCLVAKINTFQFFSVNQYFLGAYG
jgi:hypothetical protein